jgi:hypothetical protein
MTGTVLAVIGILLALGVPLFVEWSRRPKLMVERGDDANQRDVDPPWRIVHVKIANLPLRGLLGRWLLRNPATACRVAITFKSTSDGSEVQMAGRWSGSPEPLSLVPLPPRVPIAYAKVHPQAGIPDIQWYFDHTKLPETLRTDLSADFDGEVVAVAIKRKGDNSSFGFTSESYAFPDFCSPELELPDEEYLVTVEAFAGGIRKASQFRLRNTGSAETGLRLELISKDAD